jgi:hypothetical protein
MIRICCALAVVLTVGLPVRAQPQTIRLTVEAAAAPVPALKYQLLPELRDTHPGNAALLYQRAHSPEWFSGFRRHPDYLKAADWVELPADRVPWNRVEGLLPRNALKEVDLAARREYCDWELTDRLRKDGFYLLLPDFQGFREYAVLLALRARLELREGRIDKAVYTCQTGLALSRHAADAPTLINGLIGIAIANTMLGLVEGIIERGGSPNLYWALTDLPRSFIDLRIGLQSERLSLEAAMLPRVRAALVDPKAAPMSFAELQEIARKFEELDSGKTDFSALSLAVVAAKIHPRAKQFLLKRGFSAAQVDDLPVVQVAFMYALAEYDRHFDNMVKWAQLPYWEARPGLLQAERELKLSKARLPETGGIPLAELLIPACRKVVLSRARLDRRIAALRCVEAIRLHAAAHEGRLPAELSDIKEVPVPIDPITGKSFQYRLDGSAVVLSGPPPEGEQPAHDNSLRYEITLRQ